jgi:hypothetical protein
MTCHESCHDNYVYVFLLKYLEIETCPGSKESHFTSSMMQVLNFEIAEQVISRFFQAFWCSKQASHANWNLCHSGHRRIFLLICLLAAPANTTELSSQSGREGLLTVARVT